MKPTAYALFILLSFGVACSAAPKKQEVQTQLEKIKLVKVVEGLGILWGFDFLPSGELLVTEKSGRLLRLDPGSGKVTQVKGLPKVQEYGQGGLMDVKLHPNFSTNSLVYLSYVAPIDGDPGTHIARAKLIQGQLTNLQVLHKSSPSGSGGRHFGSRLAFDKNGYLYFTIGDRGERKNAQKLNLDHGKVFRIKDDGKIPRDNPFVKLKNARAAIWSYGHRNPQGIYFHPHTGELWEQEHGPRGGDEINLIKKGANYGWPVITYGKEYWGPKIGQKSKAGMEQAVKYFVPSIAPSSLMIYSGKMFKTWKGNFFSGALKLTHLNRLKVDNKKVVAEERLFESLGERVRHIAEAADGSIFFSTDAGEIFRISK